MALTYTFKPGGKQASEASDYFTSIATEQVEQSLGTMLPKQIMIEETRRPPLHLRVWSPRNAELQLRTMVPWLRQVIQKMCVISAPGVAKMGAKVFTQEELFRAVDADDVPDTYARAGRNDIERTY